MKSPQAEKARLFNRALRSAEKFRADVEALIDHLDRHDDAEELATHLRAYLTLLTTTEAAIESEAPYNVALVT